MTLLSHAALFVYVLCALFLCTHGAQEKRDHSDLTYLDIVTIAAFWPVLLLVILAVEGFRHVR
ncbi:MAG TPA: hypothetical protein VNN79_02615 [Actinomycetota bacterium]|nr:hypothetical protein [Actinomycetota bacterium]